MIVSGWFLVETIFTNRIKNIVSTEKPTKSWCCVLLIKNDKAPRYVEDKALPLHRSSCSTEEGQFMEDRLLQKLPGGKGGPRHNPIRKGLHHHFLNIQRFPFP